MPRDSKCQPSRIIFIFAKEIRVAAGIEYALETEKLIAKGQSSRL